ncbi:MAG TPA: amino acid ABC transporter substrate-binding protein [Anaerolineales bacterium]|jgi:general L-amino acid transport system substrate-binding protein|nr:amino acid ABC transporter substrate-binding protein [Anaerolineales bacterium]
MYRKLIPVFTFLIAVALIASACGGAETSTPAAQSTEAPPAPTEATSAESTEPPQAQQPVQTVVVTVEVPGQAAPSQPQGYGTITARVRDRGRVVCGVHTELLGFGYLDENGRNVGFDIDLCRSVAAAVLGDPEAIEAVPITAADRGPVLQTGEVDLVTRNMTWTSKRDAEWGNFTWIMFYDGQGFLVRADSGIQTLQDMDGASVCVTTGTTTEKNLATSFGDAGLTYEAVTFEETSAVYGAYEEGRCDVATSDKSQLAAVRAGFQNPDDHVILDITVSKEPLTPAVPSGDDQWFDIVKSVMWGLINAEEYGVTAANVEEMKASENADVRTLLGAEGDWGNAALSLEQDALANAIAAVGNYGEIYDRYMGPEGVAFTLDRGLNNLWTNGGLIYAPPIK